MKERLIYTPADAADSDTVGSYLLDANGVAITSTLVGSDQSLDVNVTQSALPAGAATEATLATLATEATVSAILADTADIEIATEATAASLAALSKAEDDVASSGDQGIMALAVRHDAEGALAADGDYASLHVDSAGRLKVAALVSVEPSDAEYLEDSAHVSGATGLFTLAVRNDAGTSLVSTDGDYAPLQVAADGSLRISGVVNPTVPNSGILSSAAAMTDVAAVIVASSLASRKRVLIENLGTKSVFIGSAAVADSDGFRVSPGSVLDLELGPSVAVYGVCSSGQSANLRILEVA